MCERPPQKSGDAYPQLTPKAVETPFLSTALAAAETIIHKDKETKRTIGLSIIHTILLSIIDQVRSTVVLYAPVACRVLYIRNDRPQGSVPSSRVRIADMK